MNKEVLIATGGFVVVVFISYQVFNLGLWSLLVGILAGGAIRTIRQNRGD